MSVDKTINDMSQVLEQIRVLVLHLNGKVEGITDRLNQTLDNFDRSIAVIASDANVMTGKVGNTVSQAPNAWVYYTISIMLILVFLLLALFLICQVGSKCFNVYQYYTGPPPQSATNATYQMKDPLPRYESKPLLPLYQEQHSLIPPSTKRPKASSSRSADSSMREEDPGYAKVRRGNQRRDHYQNEPLLLKEAQV